MVANFVPWATVPEALARSDPLLKPCPPPLTEATLHTWLEQTRRTAYGEELEQEEEEQQPQREQQEEDGEGSGATEGDVVMPDHEGGGMGESHSDEEDEMCAEDELCDEDDEACDLQEEVTSDKPVVVSLNANSEVDLDANGEPLTYRSMQRTIARGRMWSMHQFTHALKVSVFSKQMLTQYRMQNRRLWSQDEKDEAAKAASGDANEKKAAKAIEELRARAESRSVNVARLQTATQTSEWAGASLKGLGLQPPPEEDSPQVPLSAQSLSQGSQSVRVVETDELTVKAIMASVLAPPLVNDAEDAAGDDAVGQSGANARTSDVMPAEFTEVDDAELAEQVKVWEASIAEWEGAKLAVGVDCHKPRPPPPLSLEQRAFCRKMVHLLWDLRAMRRGRSDTSRQVYMQASNLKLLHLLIGQAGAGKSEMLNCLRRVMARDKLGGMSATAFTGVAVTQLIDAYTLCKLSGLPGTAQSYQHEYKQPGEDHMAAFDRMVHGAKDLAILVIDEMSFLGSTFLHHLDIRLQALLECNLPFGGLLVIMTGETFGSAFFYSS